MIYYNTNIPQLEMTDREAMGLPNSFTLSTIDTYAPNYNSFQFSDKNELLNIIQKKRILYSRKILCWGVTFSIWG